MKHAHTALARDQHGAIYVEFLTAFLPVFIFFLGLVEMTFLYTATLVTQYAANRAVRAAIVVMPDDALFYNPSESRHDVVVSAAQIALGQFVPGRVRVTPHQGLSTAAPGSVVTLTVEYDYDCKVFLIDRLLCSVGNYGDETPVLTISASASHVDQGASYAYNSEAQ